MVERPTGTGTFLFTDVEGSTRLWEQHPDAMRVALERHDEIVRTSIRDHGGFVFSTAGDAFSAAFSTAADAVAAACSAQDALGSQPWSSQAVIRVRMGVHSGVAHERDGDFFGPAVNRAARIMSVGHGGQILLSSVTAGLTEGFGLVDLGGASPQGFVCCGAAFPSRRRFLPGTAQP